MHSGATTANYSCTLLYLHVGIGIGKWDPEGCYIALHPLTLQQTVFTLPSAITAVSNLLLFSELPDAYSDTRDTRDPGGLKFDPDAYLSK